MSDLLFSTGSLLDLLSVSLARMNEAIDRYDANKLLNSNIDDLIAYFVQLGRVEPLELLENHITADQHETELEVENQFAFAGGPARIVVNGVGFTYHIPFRGDAALFRLRPSTYNYSPPSGVVRGSELVLTHFQRSGSTGNAKVPLDQELSNVRQYVAWSGGTVEPHNQSLPTIARNRINERRSRLLQNQQSVAALGYPLRSRPDAPRTYTLPDVRLKAIPAPPPASSAKFVPEPVLDDGMYEHILTVCSNMVKVMERSPAAFANMDEEAIRTHFLVQLNGQFEGRASAETFRGSGSTDILLDEQGRGVFAAECKFWRGPASVIEALDQILDYSLWRDGKAAVLLFNRNVDFSAMLAEVPDVIASHAQTTGEVQKLGDTVFRSKLRQRDDTSRVVAVTTLVFDVPVSRTPSKRLTSRRRPKK